MYLSLDRNLVDGDEVVRSSSFPTHRHDGGRGCRSAVSSRRSSLRRGLVVDVVGAWRSCSGRGRRGRVVGGAARDVVDVVAVDVVGAR